MLKVFEAQLGKLVLEAQVSDPAHDFEHVRRVVQVAKHLADAEGAGLNVVLPASWLHDIVNVAKDDPKRAQASKLAADKALELLESIGYPERHFEDVHHAITAHSFSAGIKPQTLEAKIVQDADRLDALGAIGLARCFMVSGQLNRDLYEAHDPFCETRVANDQQYCIDHFYTKLFKLPSLMNTQSAKKLADNRVQFMQRYLRQLALEIE